VHPHLAPYKFLVPVIVPKARSNAFIDQGVAVEKLTALSGRDGGQHVTGNLHESAHVAFLFGHHTPLEALVNFGLEDQVREKRNPRIGMASIKFGAGIGNLPLRRPIVARSLRRLTPRPRCASVESSLDGLCKQAIALRMQVRPRIPLRVWRENESASACPPVSRAALPH
jgi:hypothetical protein